MSTKELGNGASALLTEDLARELRQIVEVAGAVHVAAVSTEIQDGYRFVLVSVSVKEGAAISEVSRLAEICEAEFTRRVPSRADDYSWMINIRCGEKILRSVFGGWDDPAATPTHL